VLALSLFGDQPPRPNDAELTRLLVGRWAAESSGGKGPAVKGAVWLRADGTFEAEGELGSGKHAAKAKASGRWAVAGGTLTATLEKCSPPLLLKGHAHKEEVLSVTDKEWRARTEGGKEAVRARLPD
jgi:hypothetical protein